VERNSCLWVRIVMLAKRRTVVIKTRYRREVANQKISACYLTKQSTRAKSKGSRHVSGIMNTFWSPYAGFTDIP